MKILQELNNAPGTYAKMEVLKHLNQAGQKVFEYAYNPDKVYGVRFTDAEINWGFIGDPTDNMFNALDALANRQVTGHDARHLVEDIAHAHGDLIKLICNKDLDCGVQATTINKVFPGLIPKFKVQLAKEVPIENLKYPLIGQLKYDGVRLVTIWAHEQIVFKTRNGKIIHLPRIKAELEKVCAKLALKPCVLDGEVIIKQGLSVDRTKVSGMINSARSGNTINEDLLEFNIFDWLPYEDFQKQKCGLPYIERYNKLFAVVAQLPDNYKPAINYDFRSPEEVQTVYSQLIEQGQEGLILKPHHHKYTFKRSKDWVKLKEVRTADLQCIDVEMGTGKYQGMIGALVCKGKVEGKSVVVKVGSGLTDLDRAMAHGDYLYKTIEIKYNSVIEDSTTGNWSLFLPRYIAVRFDK